VCEREREREHEYVKCREFVCIYVCMHVYMQATFGDIGGLVWFFCAPMGGMIAIFAAEEAALLYKSLKGLLFVVRNGEAGLMLHKMREELKQVDMTMCVCVCGMCVCVCVCVYVCVCVCVCVVCMCARVRVYTCVCVYIHTHTNGFAHIPMYLLHIYHILSLILAPSFVCRGKRDLL